ncbi:hypothetical protein [Streptosporangium carneum]|uniref:DUF4386 domain-containing protein n=1 Tax=Streptosporangium carneum TaxID=47481 RepID=A0A9W6MDG6_9ACTN|nr:hypothetical protein [Streptosporangium carneum]GLK09778.1 hypothetical protein GCM10017600_31840 [Streptosporangium carneum]
MSLSWLLRFGAVCGVLTGLSLGVPGAIEAFTGETLGTSFVAGVGAAFAAPALTAFHLRQSAAAGRLGAIAYAVNVLGLGLFAGVSFSLNLVVFFLDGSVAAELLRGPTRVALLGSVVVFVAGSLLFGLSMLKAGVLPRVAAVGYGLSLPLLALLAPLPDTPLISGIHLLACASLIWLSLATWSRSGEPGVVSPAVPA